MYFVIIVCCFYNIFFLRRASCSISVQIIICTSIEHVTSKSLVECVIHSAKFCFLELVKLELEVKWSSSSRTDLLINFQSSRCLQLLNARSYLYGVSKYIQLHAPHTIESVKSRSVVRDFLTGIVNSNAAMQVSVSSLARSTGQALPFTPPWRWYNYNYYS